MRTEDFDYVLPPEYIAQTPAEPRDSSRLMVLERDSDRVRHDFFYNIGKYLKPGDLLVINRTRVIPARFYGFKLPSKGKVNDKVGQAPQSGNLSERPSFPHAFNQYFHDQKGC